MPQHESRLTADPNQKSTDQIFHALTGGDPESGRVLKQWLGRDASAAHNIAECIDRKHLYDRAIWELFCKLGQDLDRFIRSVTRVD